MANEKVLITGAAGRIGTMLRERMVKQNRMLRLLDSAHLVADTPSEEVVKASIINIEEMEMAMEDVDAVIHLAGISTEGAWKELLRVNIDGTHNVFEAARRSGVKRVIFASSNHVVGFYPMGSIVPDGLSPMPDTNYGVTKAAGEAIAALYSARYGMNVVSIRIGSCFSRPTDERMLSTWLSPDDAGRLFEACLSSEVTGFHSVWGMSNNSRSRFSLEAALKIGYFPVDNAELFASDVLHSKTNSDVINAYVGGDFCGSEYDSDRFSSTTKSTTMQDSK